MDVIEELKFLGKFTKKLLFVCFFCCFFFFGGGGRGVGLVGGQGGCERRIEFFLKIQKKKFFFSFFFWGGGGRGRVSGRVWGVRVDVNEELKFLGKFTKKLGGGGGMGSDVQWEGSGWGSQGGCDGRIEVFGKIHTKKNRGGSFWGGGGGGGWGVGVDVYEELKFL